MHKLNEITMVIGFALMLIGASGIMDMYGNIQIAGVIMTLGGCLILLIGGIRDVKYDSTHGVQSQRYGTYDTIPGQYRGRRKASNN